MRRIHIKPLGRTALLLLAFALLLGGCRLDPIQGPLLDSGGYVEVLDGIRLAASEDALESPVELDATRVDAPFAVTPLPPGVEAVGEAFRLAGDRDAYAVGDALIVIGVPVPSGTPTEDLALAVLQPPDALDDGDGDNAEWILLPGTFDADSETLAVGLGAILSEGSTMVLVRSPDHDSVATSTQQIDPAQIIEFEEGFRVRCVGFSGGACTATDRSTTETALDEVYAAWVEGLGFPEPRLTRRVEIAGWIPLRVRVGPYEYELRNFTRSECQNTNGRGRYLRNSRVAYTCYDASQAAPAHRTTRHEFFHALQYGYPEHLDNRSSISNAVAEGTARAAETSQVVFQRSPRTLRSIDSRLFTTGGAIGADYLAQDFWIYLGFRFGMGLDYLQPILEAGATTTMVDTVLSTHAGYPENLTLPEAYWAWAKNQAFEKTIDIGGGVLGDSCTLNTDVVTPINVVYDVAALPAPVTATLAPTSSLLLEIDFAAATGGYDAALDVQSTLQADTLAKFYTDATGTTACETDPEGRTHSVSVEGATTRYLLVSNTNTSASANVTIAFGGFEILSPAPGTTVDEGDAITFLADLTGSTVDPGGVTVQWSYERLGGVPFTFGTTDLGETLSATPFCDGTWTVTATTIGGGATRRASVDVTVNDLGDTTLVPGCEPTVTIVEPIDGGTVAEGEAISLRADTTVEGVATYPVEWRTGSAGGPVVATGEDTTAVFAAGSVTLYATFGAAVDSVSFDVIPGDPPTASIDSPADGSFYPADFGETGITVSFEGSGTSGAGGALSGADLNWESRKEGATSWTDRGTGTTKDIFFSYFGADVNQAYEVRLIATDPATQLTAVDTISITVQRPPD